MPILALEVRLEPDIVLARQRARQIAGLLGFAHLDQTRIATATSEIARNAFQYAGGGRVEFLVETGPPAGILIRVRERGPGIRDLQAILDGRYVSETGMGLGIAGARRLMDRFTIETEPGGGNSVSMAKIFNPRTRAITPRELAAVSAELAREAPRGLLQEIQQQNQELLSALQELRERQAELAQMHSLELDETNRGVLALYTELDENAMALKRLADLKSRFLSEMSHELRSPLNSIRSLSGFLLDRGDGELNDEQEKQVRLIRKAAEDLMGLVDDLLDLARVEAGKARIRPGWFEIGTIFEGLQGTIRPIVERSSVALVFEDPAGLPPLYTDEGKLTQILRNFLSNAAKFTERGEIRVAAHSDPEDRVVFSVTDSGIGIAAGDLPRIFEEFGQVENPLQRRTKGTGLGLPLSRKLAEVLGGGVTVRSEPGLGSTFAVTIPRIYRQTGEGVESASPSPAPGRGALTAEPTRVLIVDDQEEARYALKGLLAQVGSFLGIEAASGNEAIRRAHADRPDLIFLDLNLPDMTGFQVLDQLKDDAECRDIPVIIHTSMTLDEDERRMLSDRAVSILDKGIVSGEKAADRLRTSLEHVDLGWREWHVTES
jgi:signal transduction histidine kinase/CheY-like chemotaxis protein